jgi:hemerythrin-like domain-containing protein
MTPTEILSDEHRLIGQVLDCLEEAAGRLEDGDEIDPEFFLDAAEFVTGFADRCHHGKEEDLLFVAMTARDMPQDSGPVAVMLHEHDTGRQFTQGFRSAAEQMKAGDAGAASEVVRNVFDFVNLLREHILKEDNVLFPMADQLLSGDEMQKLSREFERVTAADEASGRIGRYRTLAHDLSAALETEAVG